MDDSSSLSWKVDQKAMVFLWLIQCIQSGHVIVGHVKVSYHTVCCDFISQANLETVPLDLSPTLVANAPAPAIKDYLKRPRGQWPLPEQLQEVQQMPLCVALVGSKESHNPQKEARHSWSPGEMLLISYVPKYIRQGLIAAKFTYKHRVKINRSERETDDGRSYVGTYHLKTTLLNHLEKTPPSKINSAFQTMMNIFHDLCVYLNKGYLPHYFLPDCNLLATVREDERQIALQTIQDIVRDPISTMLKCPSEPTEIYGDICADDLVAAFHSIAAHPCSAQRQEDLDQLLSRLDEWRDWCYVRLLHTDWNEAVSYRVTGRPGLKALVDMLNIKTVFPRYGDSHVKDKTVVILSRL